MPKNSNARGANREARSESSPKESRREKQDRHNARSQANPARGQGDDDQRQQNRARKRAEGGTSKGGCLPKLFMLVLPFIAAGAYFLLRS